MQHSFADMKRGQHGEAIVVSAMLLLVAMLFIFTLISLTGYDIALSEPSQQILEVAKEDSRSVATSRCQEIHPTESSDYYVDPEGACAPCSDSNAGTVTKPWCTIQRALDTKQAVHFKGSNRLYLRGGIHRYDSLKLPTVRPDGSHYRGYLGGSIERPTVITSYPGESASIYASERPGEWEKKILSDGSIVWILNWRKYLEKHFPLYLQEKNFFFSNAFYLDPSPKVEFLQIPQAVFIDRMGIVIPNPLILRQANESQIAIRSWAGENSQFDVNAHRYYKDYANMPAGYVYYDNRLSSENFGFLYVKLPSELGGQDANTLPIEIPLDYVSFLGPYVHERVLIANVSFRFSNSMLDYEGKSYYTGHDGGLMFNSPYGVLENVDLSYHVFRGAVGSCDHCRIINSTFLYNGNTGSSLVGNNITYEGNLFRGNSLRPFSLAWNAGGMKLIAPLFNFTIRNNLFQDDGASIGMWLDFNGDGGNILERRKRDGTEITWDNYIGVGHIIEGNIFWNDGLAIETSPGSATRPIVIKNNLFLGENNALKKAINIQSAPFVIIENNIFSNFHQAIVVDTIIDYKAPEHEYRVRNRQTDVKVSKNIFLNVSFPIVFGEETSYSHPLYPLVFVRNTADSNVYYGTRKPNPVFRRIMNNVDFKQPFSQRTASHPLNELRTYTVHRSAYDKDDDSTNGISPNIGLENDDYEWYKERSIEELENTIYFSKGLLLSYEYLDWGVHKKYTLDEWRTATGNDKHSINVDPRIVVDTKGIHPQQDSPALQIGFRDIDLSRVPFEETSLRIVQPKGEVHTREIRGLTYQYDGLPLRACWYSKDGGRTNFTFTCDGTAEELVSVKGENAWKIYLQDELLRVHALLATFFVDTDPPHIRNTFTLPPSPLITPTSAHVTFHADIEDAQQATLVLDNVRYPATLTQGTLYKVERASLGIGKHEYFWEARDALGNTAVSNQIYTYLIQRPISSRIVLEFPRSGEAYTAVDILKYTVSEDAVNCWYSLNGGLTNTTLVCGENKSALSPSEGTHHWLIGMRNTTNVVLTSKSSFLVDRTVPVITLQEPTPREQAVLTRDTITINVSITDASLQRVGFVLKNSTRIAASGELRQPPFLWKLSSLSPEQYTLVVNATDRAGNVRVSELRRFSIVREQPQQPSQLLPVVHRFSHGQLTEGVALKVKEGEEVALERNGVIHTLRFSISSNDQALLFFRGIYYTLALGTQYHLALESAQKSDVMIKISSLNFLERSVSGSVVASSTAQRETQDATAVQPSEEDAIQDVSLAPETQSQASSLPLQLPVAQQPEQAAEQESVQEEALAREAPAPSPFKQVDKTVLALVLVFVAASLLAVLLYWLVGRPVRSPSSKRTPYDY